MCSCVVDLLGGGAAGRRRQVHAWLGCTQTTSTIKVTHAYLPLRHGNFQEVHRDTTRHLICLDAPEATLMPSTHLSYQVFAVTSHIYPRGAVSLRWGQIRSSSSLFDPPKSTISRSVLLMFSISLLYVRSQLQTEHTSESSCASELSVMLKLAVMFCIYTEASLPHTDQAETEH